MDAEAVILENFRCGVILLDKARMPLFMNSAARRQLTETGVLHLDGNGELRSGNSKFDRALHDAVNNAPQSHGLQAASVDHDTGLTAAWVTPVTGAVDPVGRAAALVMVMTSKPQQIPAAVLRDLLDITEAEGRLLSRLIAGNTLSECAREARVSYNTVRNQMRSMMSKTSAKSQNELLVMVHRLLPPTCGCAPDS